MNVAVIAKCHFWISCGFSQNWVRKCSLLISNYASFSLQQKLQVTIVASVVTPDSAVLETFVHAKTWCENETTPTCFTPILSYSLGMRLLLTLNYDKFAMNTDH